MKVLSPYTGQGMKDETLGYTFWCPGCAMYHSVTTVKMQNKPCWGFDGNLEKPTFSPSILVRGVKSMTKEQYREYMTTGKLPEQVPYICHSFIRNGEWQFLDDCTHELKGKTVPMVDLDELERQWDEKNEDNAREEGN
jgi:hypothetical protein